MNKPIIANTALGPIEYFQRHSVGDRKGVVVAIHGAMGGYDQSDVLARTIGPEGYRYISISRPGYLGTPINGRETPEAQADLIGALLEHLNIEKASLFAISGGGYSAIHFALRHPQKCVSLVLCSTTGGKNEVPIPFAFNVMKVFARLPLIPGLMQKKAAQDLEASLKNSISFPDILAETAKNKPIMELYAELAVGGLNQMSNRLAGTTNDIKVTQTTEYPLTDISVPTLVVHGTHDPIVPFNEHGKRLAEEIPGAKLCLAERGEHVTIFTHNIMIRKAVSEFMSELNSGDNP